MVVCSRTKRNSSSDPDMADNKRNRRLIISNISSSHCMQTMTTSTRLQTALEMAAVSLFRTLQTDPSRFQLTEMDHKVDRVKPRMTTRTMVLTKKLMALCSISTRS